MFDRCETCGERHHPRQAHRFATNTVSTNEDRLTDSTNKDYVIVTGPWDNREVLPTVEMPKNPTPEQISKAINKAAGITANGRSREAYNAYQRDYMRRKRAQ